MMQVETYFKILSFVLDMTKSLKTRYFYCLKFILSSYSIYLKKRLLSLRKPSIRDVSVILCDLGTALSPDYLSGMYCVLSCFALPSQFSAVKYNQVEGIFHLP